MRGAAEGILGSGSTTFGREDFDYDAGRDLYRCPGGQLMRTSGTPRQ